ncbi:MAG: hypothetical protein HOP15_08490 [Planctomycetes bacterium]|nr:hypothetical protein [Planctomycetota bacterium]
MAPVELPESVTRLLWDTDASAVTWEAHRQSVLGRVLAHGDWDALRWLRTTAGDEAIRAWIVATRGRRLSRRQIRFWQLLLDLPEDEVEAWLALPERQVWDDRCA